MNTALADELTTLLAELVSIESYSGTESAVQARILAWFAENGIPATLEAADGGLANVVVEIDGGSPGPCLFLGGHCDTVGVAAGWTRAPHSPSIENGRLYGLGAMDMKAGLAAAMFAARALHASQDRWSGRLVFAALADEEAYSRGANAFVRADRAIDAAIMCEPHFDDVVIGAMGKINLVVEVIGRSAHASRPEEGINAVVEAGRLLAAIGDLRRNGHERFGPASHCVLDIASGDGTYELRVPDRCRFRLNWQMMPGETAEEAQATLRELAATAAPSATIEIAVREPSYESFWLGENHSFVSAFAAIYRQTLGREPELAFGRGVSDANVFSGRAGIPTILFGPGGGNMHAADEWVALVQLYQAAALYEAFATAFLQVSAERRPS